MKTIVFGIVVLLVFVAGWLFVSPLFIDQSVDEPLDFTLPGGGIDVDRVMSLHEDRRAEMMQQIMDMAESAPDTMASEEMPKATPTVVAQGRFVDADAVHRGSGLATLYSLADGEHIVRFENFRTTNGPDLVVYLATHPAPKLAADVTSGGFVKLGKLKGNVGNQNYAVPTGTDVTEYGSVIIWCELFGVLFSPAALSRDSA